MSHWSEEQSPLKENKKLKITKMTDENQIKGIDIEADTNESGSKKRRKLRNKNNPKFKSRSNKYGTTLRQVNALLREVEIIEEACSGNKKKKEKKLDEFQQAKKDLSEKLNEIKTNIKLQKGIQARLGNNSEAIKLKNQIQKDLNEAKQLHSELEEAYKTDKYKTDNNREDALSNDKIKEREQLVSLLKQDLDYTEHGYEPKKDIGRGYGLARQQRNRRQKKREEGNLSEEPVPLTEKQQAFIQMSIKRDQVIDEKLDEILQSVKQVNAIGMDVNEELKKQDIILDNIDEKMTHVSEKLERRNKQMKELLDASGGLQRWCPIVILLVLLLAVLGWIWNSLSK